MPQQEITQHEFVDHETAPNRYKVCKHCDLCFDKVQGDYFTRSGEAASLTYICITRKITEDESKKPLAV